MPDRASLAQTSRATLLAQFVRSSSSYYQREFTRIGGQVGMVWSFNVAAFLLGPIWFGMRGLWKWGLPFAIAEAFAIVQVVRGIFGDLSQDALARIADIESTLALRHRQLAAAIEKNSDKTDKIRAWITSLEGEISAIQQEITARQDQAIWVALAGVAMLITVKAVQGMLANRILEQRFSDWLSDRTIKPGMNAGAVVMSTGFVVFVYTIGILHYGFSGGGIDFTQFPTNPAYRMQAIEWIVGFFAWLTSSSSGVFYSISYGIRLFLDYLEVLFVQTPWPIVAGFIVLLTGLTAGGRGALFAATSLVLIGLFGFWEKSMTTLALLGTAACISISIGIPLGVFCARRERFYNVIRPIMDFMQTMPSFVFMIPVIALFSVGKPAAIVITMIFGGTPVVRLTVLGMRGVPESIREAAIAYGASKWYLLTKVDLPLAAPSIFAGVNQTIMLSLAMVVVASLIGAKGLGEDVLEALQYANVGQGILAGFAILFCAMILNRIIQGGPVK